MNAMTLTAQSPTPRAPWWRRMLLDPVLDQLRQGITPEKIALTAGIGAMLGIFPALGTTTALCLMTAYLLRLNQPVMQLVNHLFYPLQLLLIPVFIRMGEWIYGAPPIPFSITQMLGKFRAAPLGFFREFAGTFLHCITAWMLFAPVGIALIYLTLRPVLRTFVKRMKK